MRTQIKTIEQLAESDPIAMWCRYYSSLKESYLFPNEYVVRTFLGSYPELRMKKDYKGARIGDIGCGDGRNMTALNKLGFDIYGSEVSDEICSITKRKLLVHPDNIKADIREGFNHSLPFENEFLDYVLSWNACYYMQDEHAKFSDHVVEFARVMKKGGYFVACVPAPTCFSLKGAERIGDNKIRIATDSKWSIINGTVLHTFDSPEAIEKDFGSHFENFSHGHLRDDCFGLALDYFIFVCQKR